ncbi:hypothetical protein PP175_04595 [Aneurinibacillus sp. Ricciae_BoGa-3]|uniref:hypothetical protein n=1 Tax=Aneurinibacillus sp. Ricciae_BoGa-3 TaxID=3022697 RepID=UPI00233FF496|nr:hypothetical protein [Aneurinibacillus sp. Ricciae_BoGa-3]WCK55268.1 hypothetical protein PP175_04595 [Aneurinibacillus sp. Ricciae_BoGa-3]
MKGKKRGLVLMGVGGMMLMGILHLGFLIPMAIAALLIYKGWHMVKGAQGTLFACGSDNRMMEGFPTGQTPKYDPLDEWEQSIKK